MASVSGPAAWGSLLRAGKWGPQQTPAVGAGRTGFAGQGKAGAEAQELGTIVDRGSCGFSGASLIVWKNPDPDEAASGHQDPEHRTEAVFSTSLRVTPPLFSVLLDAEAFPTG